MVRSVVIVGDRGEVVHDAFQTILEGLGLSVIRRPFEDVLGGDEATAKLLAEKGILIVASHSKNPWPSAYGQLPIRLLGAEVIARLAEQAGKLEAQPDSEKLRVMVHSLLVEDELVRDHLFSAFPSWRPRVVEVVVVSDAEFITEKDEDIASKVRQLVVGGTAGTLQRRGVAEEVNRDEFFLQLLGKGERVTEVVRKDTTAYLRNLLKDGKRPAAMRDRNDTNGVQKRTRIHDRLQRALKSNKRKLAALWLLCDRFLGFVKMPDDIVAERAQQVMERYQHFVDSCKSGAKSVPVPKQEITIEDFRASVRTRLVLWAERVAAFHEDVGR